MANDIRDAIFADAKRREEKITIAGKEVTVRELATAADLTFLRDGKDQECKLIVHCVYGPDDELAFSDDDVEMLKTLGRFKILPLIEAVNRVNGLNVAAELKNSEAAPSGG